MCKINYKIDYEYVTFELQHCKWIPNNSNIRPFDHNRIKLKEKIRNKFLLGLIQKLFKYEINSI